MGIFPGDGGLGAAEGDLLMHEVAGRDREIQAMGAQNYRLRRALEKIASHNPAGCNASVECLDELQAMAREALG